MPMNQIIQEKRKSLGLTQEQVADFLGVSTPAVSKWETGASCPDLAILPPLARLLKTDLNTLLCFRETLTREEMQGFCRELSQIWQTEGTEAAFRRAEAVMREYPGNEELMQTLTLHLDGVVISSGTKGFDEKLESWHRRLERSEDPVIRNTAQTMLVSRLIRREEYALAQETLDRIPDREKPMTADKLYYQTTIDLHTGRGEKAAADLEQALLEAVQRVQLLLSRLVGAELFLGNLGAARAVGEKAEALVSLMELWDVHRGGLLPVALKEQNVEESLALMEQVLRGTLTPWKVEHTTLYHRLAPQYRDVHFDFRALEGMIPSLEEDPDCAFLRDDPRFEEMLQRYREELKKRNS